MTTVIRYSRVFSISLLLFFLIVAVRPSCSGTAWFLALTALRCASKWPDRMQLILRRLQAEKKRIICLQLAGRPEEEHRIVKTVDVEIARLDNFMVCGVEVKSDGSARIQIFQLRSEAAVPVPVPVAYGLCGRRRYNPLLVRSVCLTRACSNCSTVVLARWTIRVASRRAITREVITSSGYIPSNRHFYCIHTE